MLFAIHLPDAAFHLARAMQPQNILPLKCGRSRQFRLRLRIHGVYGALYLICSARGEHRGRRTTRSAPASWRWEPRCRECGAAGCRNASATRIFCLGDPLTIPSFIACSSARRTNGDFSRASCAWHSRRRRFWATRRRLAHLLSTVSGGIGTILVVLAVAWIWPKFGNTENWLENFRSNCTN